MPLIGIMLYSDFIYNFAFKKKIKKIDNVISNMIKTTSLTCSILLICHDTVRDIQKLYHGQQINRFTREDIRNLQEIITLLQNSCQSGMQ